MPELPEVETIRRVLAEVLPDLHISEVSVKREKMLRGQSRGRFIDGLMGRRITGVDRRGKFLIVRMDSGSLLIHLGMSGKVIVRKKGESDDDTAPDLPDKHTHLILKLSGGRHLYFRDPRMFGRFQLLPVAEERRLRERLGPEPLGRAFSTNYLQRALSRRKAPIKTALLDQKLVAGIGNIYADEALFRAGIGPHTSCCRLLPEEVETLRSAVRSVLREAVRRKGTSISDYVDPRNRRGTFQLRLEVYGREGQLCRRCGSPIRKDVLAQRGTHWCPRCQSRG